MTMRICVAEAIGTFALVFCGTGVSEEGVMAGIAVGSVVTLESLFAGPITGASMNPARSLGPALVSGQIEHLWTYLTAPILGSSLAVLTCRVVMGSECCKGSES